MKLAAYTSVARLSLPNLVALQDERYTALATVLVCPLRAGLTLTDSRVEVPWGGEVLIACPELIRPIRRTALHARGWIDEVRSQEILTRLRLLLAR